MSIYDILLFLGNCFSIFVLTLHKEPQNPLEVLLRLERGGWQWNCLSFAHFLINLLFLNTYRQIEVEYHSYLMMSVMKLNY